MTATIEHDNSTITLVIQTTVGACGIDPSTDGSCGPDDAVQIRGVACMPPSEIGGGARTTWSVWARGLTLQGSLDGASPSYLECPGIDQHAIWRAVDRVLGDEAWAAFAASAEIALETEACVADDDEWIATMAIQRPRCDAALAPYLGGAS